MSFSPSAKADRGGGGGVYWVKPPKLPTVAGDAWVAPHVRVAPMLTKQPVVALVGDFRPRRCKYPSQILRGRKRAYRRQFFDADGRSRSRAWMRPTLSPGPSRQ